MIRILDKNLRFVDYLRKYTFSQFARSFRTVGAFQIDAKLVEENLYLLNRKEQFFVLFGYEDFGIIEKIEKESDSEYERNIRLSGRMSLALLTKRIVYKTFKYKGASSTFIKNIILSNMVESPDNNRNLNIAVMFLYEDLLSERTSNINKSVTGGYVWDAVKEVLELDKLGIKFVPIVESKQSETDVNINRWNLCISPGIDRTKHNKKGNEAVVFSQSLSNIKTTEYRANMEDYRNVAYIAGEGEGSERKWYQQEINQEDSKGGTGWNRSELWIDARDIQSEDAEGNTIPESEYEEMIRERIEERSEEGVLKDEYNATVVQENKLYTYKKDYDLGDFVTVVDNELGVEIDAQITEILVSEQGGEQIIDITLSYGNVSYNLAEQVKQNKTKTEENYTTLVYLENQIKKSGSGNGGVGGTTPSITDIDDISVSFEMAENKTQINSGDVVSVLFGKIAKWIDWIKGLKNVAFSASYDDLVNLPQLFSGDYNDLRNKPTIPVIPDIPEIPEYNGAVTTVLNDDLEQNKVLISDTNGKIAVSEITKTQLSFLDGLTGNIQEQIDSIGSGGGGTGGEGTPLMWVTNLVASGKRGSVELSWNDPEDIIFNNMLVAEFAGTKVVRNTERYPSGVEDGTLAIDSKTRNQYSESSFVDEGLTNDIDYYYTLFPYTTKGVYTYSDKNKAMARPLGFDPVLANNTWEMIALASESGIAKDIWKIGDDKDGCVIIGFDHDDLADGSGKAGITFVCNDNTKTMSSIWRASTSSYAFYKTSAAYANLEDVYTSIMNGNLIQDVGPYIREVKKPCMEYGSVIDILSCYLFLFSSVECIPNSSGNDGKSYEGAELISHNVEYWTRSKPSFNSDRASYVTKSGSISSAYMTYNYLLRYGFCI